jgi:hypothetical protein
MQSNITIDASRFSPDIPNKLLRATAFDCIFNSAVGNTDNQFDDYDNFTYLEYQQALSLHKKVCAERAKYLLCNATSNKALRTNINTNTPLTNEKNIMDNLNKELKESTVQSDLLTAVIEMIAEQFTSANETRNLLLKAATALNGKQLNPTELQLVLESLPLGDK